MPTPKKKRPGIIVAVVAAACATIAGCIRIKGQVTPLPTRIRSVDAKDAPDEGAVSLARDPRVEVIGDHGERQAGGLGHHGVAHEV